MNNHQSLKAEIDTREDNFTACISLGKELLTRNHYASNEVCLFYDVPRFYIFFKSYFIIDVVHFLCFLD